MTTPLVSVLLPVYNGGPWINEALDSILQQTLSDIEVIAINDGSKDDSLLRLRSYRDPRLKVHDQPNQGLSKTLNTALALSRGRYLARQDQDDVAMSSRLESQVRYLKSHPDVGVVGTWARIIDSEGKTIGHHRHPFKPERIAVYLLWNNPFVHSSLMFRREVFESVGTYSTDPSRQPPEDYELLSRIARVWKTANIPQVLQIYREVRGSMSRVTSNPFDAKVVQIASENWAAAFPNANAELCWQAARLLNGLDPRVGTKGQNFSLLSLVKFLWAGRKCAVAPNSDAARSGLMLMMRLLRSGVVVPARKALRD